MIKKLFVLGLCGLMIFLGAPAVAQSGDVLEPADPRESDGAPTAPLTGASTAEVDEGSWIVTLEAALDEPSEILAIAAEQLVIPTHLYDEVLNGFAFEGSEFLAQALEQLPGVATVEPNRLFHAVEAGSTGMFRIDGELTYAAGDRGRMDDGTPVRIAILDTGIDTNHSDLAPNLDLSQSINCISPGQSPEDDQGHGTHVAGIAAAADDGAGMAGIASQAKIVAAKVLNSQGSGTDAQVLCGLNHIAALAADGVPTVVNLSLGEFHDLEGPECSSSAMHQAVCNLVDLGVTVVAASGNNGLDGTNFYPAAYEEVIAVSGFTTFDNDPGGSGCEFLFDVGYQCDEALASFSNHGPIIDVTAPGVRIQSSTFNGGHGTKSGTSMASPFAAGVAALVLAEDPSLSPAGVRAIMQRTGECPDGSISGATTCAGHGQWQMSNGLSSTAPDPDGIPEPLINAFNAVAAAAGSSGPDTTPPIINIGSPSEGAAYEAGIDDVTANYDCFDFGSGVASCVGDVPNGDPIDTSTPGTGFTFSVTATDNESNTDTATVTYDVVDTTAPVIVLNGDDPMVHPLGTPFADPGAELTDNVDPSTTISGASDVNANVAGTYSITYDYTDAAGNAADQVSRVVYVVPAPPPAVPDAVDLSGLAITPYGVTQDLSGGASAIDGGQTFFIHGNAWKKVPLAATIGPDTVLEFDFYAPQEGEIHGIGFDSDDVYEQFRTFEVHGTQTWGIQDFNDYPGSGWKHYAIPVGDYYTGTFDFLYFVNDDDVGSAGSALFANVQLVEVTPAEPPPTPPAVAGSIDFSGLFVTPYGVTQDLAGGATVMDGGRTLELVGNTWKKVNWPTVIGPDTILEFDFWAGPEGEIHGIGFDDDDVYLDMRTFEVAGTFPWGIQDFHDFAGTDWVRYSIPVGDYYTGAFDFIYFVNDDDATATARSRFANVTVSDPTVPAAPPAVGDAFDLTGLAVTPYGVTQDLSGGAGFADGGRTIELVGNSWKKIALPAVIGPDTVLEFDFWAGPEGEIQGIGFDDDDVYISTRTFEIAGIHTWGIQDFHDYPGSGWVHYSIPVGDYYTGAFEYLYFVNDDDASAAARSRYANITISDPAVPAAPAAVPGALDFVGLPVTPYGVSQDLSGGAGIFDGGRTLELAGNTWKKVPLPAVIGPDTVLEFDFWAGPEGEIQGVGFDTDDVYEQMMTFEIAGTYPWGIQDFHDYPGSGWVHYSIPVGDYYTGVFGFLYIVNDDDALSAARSRITNVVLSG